jgi:hypothetical protein
LPRKEEKGPTAQVRLTYEGNLLAVARLEDDRLRPEVVLA